MLLVHVAVVTTASLLLLLRCHSHVVIILIIVVIVVFFCRHHYDVIIVFFIKFLHKLGESFTHAYFDRQEMEVKGRVVVVDEHHPMALSVVACGDVNSVSSCVILTCILYLCVIDVW